MKKEQSTEPGDVNWEIEMLREMCVLCGLLEQQFLKPQQ